MSNPDLPTHGMTPFQLGMRGVCPRCGVGNLFKGYLSLAPRCSACGLDFSFADAADGPAFFAQWAGCIPAVIFALWLEVTFSPPWWVHIFTTVPLLIVPPLLLLRPIKAWLIASQYMYKAQEGQLDRP